VPRSSSCSSMFFVMILGLSGDLQRRRFGLGVPCRACRLTRVWWATSRCRASHVLPASRLNQYSGPRILTRSRLVREFAEAQLCRSARLRTSTRWRRRSLAENLELRQDNCRAHVLAKRMPIGRLSAGKQADSWDPEGRGSGRGRSRDRDRFPRRSERAGAASRSWSTVSPADLSMFKMPSASASTTAV
jgi:hypothetical protein